MARPKKQRFVSGEPEITYFKPQGVPMMLLKGKNEIALSVEELEAVRLKDVEGLDQDRCARKMKVSRPTFHRVIGSARKKIGDALINGKALKIGGGNYMIGGRGLKGGKGLGPGGDCLCAKCGYSVPHERGVPCFRQKCPKCGSLMTRK